MNYNLFEKAEEINKWRTISCTEKLSEDFIREFQNKVIWMFISLGQELSENFIKEFENKIDWNHVVCNKRALFSEDMIRDHKSEISYWRNLLATHDLSKKFIEEFLDKFDKDQLLKRGYI